MRVNAKAVKVFCAVVALALCGTAWGRTRINR
jgi:hypothetical protein